MSLTVPDRKIIRLVAFNPAGKKIAVITVHNENSRGQFSFFDTMEEAHPSHVIVPHEIILTSNSPKEEEMMLHKIAAEFGGKLVMHENENAAGENLNLTYKEKLILELLLQGFTAKICGEKLFVSTATIQDHTKHIYKKLSVHSRGELLKKFSHRSDTDTMPY